ncbi:shikimate dehydrogenase family protein [Proteiniclasticum ruminis]|uniref:Shikimate dehydrogenase n=1 Tax=Proteiniclasticum ruminis TaxID=398199 RepID=A0A1G8FW32_9CLOT|nr:shikimate dehydrogenase [Proteiniclasticum ruminis]SDH86176.1 shikimate dehydrogenase [Proteiniclasticum ruminis]
MRKTGLLGRRISYSKSPEIHTRLFEKKRLMISYELFDLPRENIQKFIDNLTQNEIIGFNVTIPYKEEIIGYLHELDSTALECGAVNTVVIKNGWRIGYNTDVFGFMQSLEDNRISVEGKDVLILGSGGAAKAVYTALVKMDARIHMAFRSETRRKEFPKALSIRPLDTVTDIRPFALVINATKLGNIQQDEMPIEIKEYSKDNILYDLNYEPLHSSFLRFGSSVGLQVVNGESMLYNQARKSQELWIDAFNIF